MKHYGDIQEVGTFQGTTVTGTTGLFGGTVNAQTISGANTVSVQGFPIAPSMGPNLLANPTFSVSIRGFTIDAGNPFFPNNDDSYGLDTWNILSDGNNIAKYIRSTTPGGGLATGLQMTVATANLKFGVACFIGFQQTVTVRLQNLALQLQAFNNMTGSLGTLRAAILEWTGTGDTLTSDVVSSWNAAGTNPTLVANWAYVGTALALSLTTGAQQLKLEGGYIPSAAANNLAVFIWSDDTTTTVGESMFVGNVQLEASRLCTRFHYPGDAEVRTRCQYLANCSFLDGVTPVAGDGSFNGSTKITGPVATTQSFQIATHYPTRMRTVGTATILNPRATASGVSNRNLATNNSIDFVSTRVIQSNEQMLLVDNTGVTVSGSTTAFIAHYWFVSSDY